MSLLPDLHSNYIKEKYIGIDQGSELCRQEFHNSHPTFRE